MDYEEEAIYANYTYNATGNDISSESYNIVDYPFGRFNIKIMLDLRNRFIDIVEVKESRDFLSNKQRIASKNYFDAEKYYIEEEE